MSQLKVFIFIVTLTVSECYIVKKYTKRGLYGPDLHHIPRGFNSFGSNFAGNSHAGEMFLLNKAGTTYVGRSIYDVIGASMKAHYPSEPKNNYRTISQPSTHQPTPLVVPISHQPFSLPANNPVQYPLFNPYMVTASGKIPYQLPIQTTIAPPIDFTKGFTPISTKPLLQTAAYTGPNSFSSLNQPLNPNTFSSLNQPLTMFYSVPKAMPFGQFSTPQALPVRTPESYMSMIPIASPIYLNRRYDGTGKYKGAYKPTYQQYQQYRENNENQSESEDFSTNNYYKPEEPKYSQYREESETSTENYDQYNGYYNNDEPKYRSEQVNSDSADTSNDY